MAPHRLAVLGYGKIAKDQHLPAIAASPEFQLAAVVSGHAKSIEGVDRLYSREEDLYAQAPDVDCVAICGQPTTRFDSARRAILAGRHVLMEKPPAATLAETDTLRALAAEKGVVLFASWHARANAAVEEATRRLAGATVCSLVVTWKEDVHRWHPGQAWVWDAGGFGVFDPGINALSIVTAVLPAPIFVQDAKLSIPRDRQSPIAVDLTFGGLDGPGPFSAAFDWRQTGEQTWDVDVETDAGARISLTNGGSRLCVDGQEIVATADQEYPRLYARFAELLRDGKSDVDARPLQLVADAFLRGERVTVDPIQP